MARYEADVDPSLCTAWRRCVRTAPHAFVAEGDEHAAVVRGGPFTDDDEVLEAARGCPVEAIVVTDADSGEQLAP